MTQLHLNSYHFITAIRLCSTCLSSTPHTPGEKNPFVLPPSAPRRGNTPCLLACWRSKNKGTPAQILLATLLIQNDNTASSGWKQSILYVYQVYFIKVVSSSQADWLNWPTVRFWFPLIKIGQEKVELTFFWIFFFSTSFDLKVKSQNPQQVDVLSYCSSRTKYNKYNVNTD